MGPMTLDFSAFVGMRMTHVTADVPSTVTELCDLKHPMESHPCRSCNRNDVLIECC
jgi:hypothetical protein